jgi:opacity protein-like surface antigen
MVRKVFQTRSTLAIALSILRLAALGAVVCTGAWAQLEDEGTGEFSLYSGLTFGPTGTHAAFAGSTGVSLSRYTVIAIEGGYSSLGNRTLAYHPGDQTRNSGLFDFDFALRIRVPVKQRWEPYAVLAPALLLNAYHKQVQLPDGTLKFVSGQNEVKFGFGSGGGVRYHMSENWGVLAEYRYTVSTRNFSRFLVGVFRQF